MSSQTSTKRDLVERIAEKKGLAYGTVLEVVQGFMDDVIEELAKGNRLEFRDFGVFEPVSRRARIALNPKTLEKITVAPRVVVKFKVGRLLREKVETLKPEVEKTGPAAEAPAG